MGQQTILLEIKSPCKADWEGMQSVGNAKFCQHCQKTVIDFTGASQPEIFNYFNNAKGPVCGRFFKQQLGVIHKPDLPAKRTILRKIAAGLFILSLPLTSELKAFPKAPYVLFAEQQNENVPDSNTNTGSDSMVIRGIVTDSSENRYKIQYVKVCYKKQFTYTDSSGAFTLIIPTPKEDKVKLKFENSRLLKKMNFTKEELSKLLNIILPFEMDEVLLGGLAYTN